MSFQEYAESAKGRLRLGSINAKAMAGVAAVLLLAGAAVAFNVAGSGASEPLTVQKADASEAQAAEEAPTEPARICVHVDGCVANPGIVYIEEGSRVADAVQAAGGMTEEASSSGMNLARVLQDGEQVVVPSAAQAVPTQASEGASQAAGAAAQAGAAASGKVNINTASAAELQTLSGIGPSKAQKIVDHRLSSGPFESVDGLTEVSGIGDKTLEAIRDQVCV